MYNYYVPSNSIVSFTNTCPFEITSTIDWGPAFYNHNVPGNNTTQLEEHNTFYICSKKRFHNLYVRYLQAMHDTVRRYTTHYHVSCICTGKIQTNQMNKECGTALMHWTQVGYLQCTYQRKRTKREYEEHTLT